MPSPSPGPSVNDLFGVSAVSSHDAWAVGDYSPAGGGSDTLIEHWDGSQWSAIPSPSPGPNTSTLYAVSAVTHTDAWSVGYYSPPAGGTYTLIEHWDGSQWSVIPSPNPSSVGNLLFGVSAVSSSDAWAVGIQAGYTLIEHWDGSQWSVIPSPNPGQSADYLYGVSAVSSSDAWAAGYDTPSGGGTHTLIEHWDGSQWRTVHSPSPGPVVNLLYGVAAIPTHEVWAVGSYSPPNGSAPTLIERWHGSRWQHVHSPSPGAFGNLLLSVSALSPSNAWAVGEYLSNSQTVYTLTEHWNGSRWQVVSSPNPGPDHLLRGVAQVPGTAQAWTVGYYNNGSVNQTLIEFFCA